MSAVWSSKHPCEPSKARCHCQLMLKECHSSFFNGIFKCNESWSPKMGFSFWWRNKRWICWLTKGHFQGQLTWSLFFFYCCVNDRKERGMEWIYVSVFFFFLTRAYSKGIWTSGITYSTQVATSFPFNNWRLPYCPWSLVQGWVSYIPPNTAQQPVL